jgi:hypothetical protein
MKQSQHLHPPSYTSKAAFSTPYGGCDPNLACLVDCHARSIAPFRVRDARSKVMSPRGSESPSVPMSRYKTLDANAAALLFFLLSILSTHRLFSSSLTVRQASPAFLSLFILGGDCLCQSHTFLFEPQRVYCQYKEFAKISSSLRQLVSFTLLQRYCFFSLSLLLSVIVQSYCWRQPHTPFAGYRSARCITTTPMAAWTCHYL